MSAQFWREKSLKEMSGEEWESLCDRCGRCCLISLEDEDTGEIHLTDYACKLFDSAACSCSDYANRATKVKDCVQLTPDNVGELTWLPRTCAYRLVHEGKDLAWWHPLVSGSVDTVHQARASVRGKTRPERKTSTAALVRRIVVWPDPTSARGRRRTD